MRAPVKSLPSQEALLSVLNYDEDSGVLTWKSKAATSRSNICFNSKAAGQIAGTLMRSGYITVGISGKYYSAHRIIWKIMTGLDPEHFIDHRDTNRSNNRWKNLREAKNGENIQNSRIRKDNKSGAKGVFWELSRQSWIVAVGVNGKQKRIGRYKEFHKACEARKIASEQMHGAFARSI